MMGHQDLILLIYAVAQLAGTAHAIWRINVVEKKLGNGGPGVFMRRDVAEEKHRDIYRRIDALEKGE